jgi:Flp pilus assembly protein TadG
MSRRWNDGGNAAIQAAIIYPLVLAVVIVGVQAALWGYARNVAQTAAREGVATGRMHGAGPEAGAMQAQSALDRLAGSNFTGHHVSTVGSTPERVRIRVTGTALSLIPGIPNWPVSVDASGAVERWTTPEGG